MKNKEIIQQLVFEGKIDVALEELKKIDSDAEALQIIFNNGKRQYQMGMIDFYE